MIRNKNINLRCTEEEKELLKIFCKAKDVKISNLVRMALNEYLKINLEVE